MLSIGLAAPHYLREYLPQTPSASGVRPPLTRKPPAAHYATVGFLVGPEGLEPPTPGLKARRSAR